MMSRFGGFKMRPKSVAVILCILGINDQILDGLCDNSVPIPSEREKVIECETKKPEKHDDVEVLAQR